MTMKIYAKVHGQTKRQALGKLPYGKGASGPEHLIPVQFGHQLVTGQGAGGEGGPEAVAR